jgi:hypothetical protein
MNYYALDEALEYIEEKANPARKVLDYTVSTVNIKGQINSTIKAIKEKLSTIKSKEDKKKYLTTQKANAKKGMTWRKNHHASTAMKSHIENEYQKLFNFIDSELEKL